MVNEPSLELLQKGSSEAFQKLYEAYKHDFFLFARKFKVASSDITDIYQDTFITFYENLINGKVTEFSSSIKTYLFAIGKFKIYAYLKNKSKLSLITMNEIYEPVLLDMDLDTDELTERQTRDRRGYANRGDSREQRAEKRAESREQRATPTTCVFLVFLFPRRMGFLKWRCRMT